MKSQRIWLPVLLAASTCLLAQQPAGKVAVINIQGALVSTKDGQNAAAALEAKAAPKRKELEARENDINQLRDKLQKGANTLSDALKQQLYRDIDEKTKRLKRDAEDAEAEFNQEQQKTLQQLGQKVMVVIDKYARDKGYTLVLDVSSPQTPVLYASNAIDITKDIIELYDRNSPGDAAGAPAPSADPKPAPAKPAAQAKPGGAN